MKRVEDTTIQMASHEKNLDFYRLRRVILVAGLVMCNVIWACNPVMAKYVLAEVGPVPAAWLRILASALVVSVAFPFVPKTRSRDVCAMQQFPWLRAALIGVITFFITPMLVYTGVDNSLASHNAFITGMEPIITILLARLILRERVSGEAWLILAFAAAGFALLSGVANQWIGLVAGPYVLGNLLLLLAMAGEAMFSIIGGRLLRIAEPVAILATALLTGALLFAGYHAATGTFPAVTQLSARAWLSVFWSGPLSTAGCMLFWLYAIRYIPVNAAAFSLFIQPLLGATLGYFLLGERLGFLSLGGASLIMFALGWYSLTALRRPAPEQAPATP